MTSVIQIANDHGGVIADYAARYNAWLLSGRSLAIVGLCASACTLALGFPPDRVCVTSDAVLEFHAASDPMATMLIYGVYPPAIQRWVDEHHAMAGQAVTRMSGEEAIRLGVPRC